MRYNKYNKKALVSPTRRMSTEEVVFTIHDRVTDLVPAYSSIVNTRDLIDERLYLALKVPLRDCLVELLA